MNSSTVLRELLELKETWRKQNFNLSSEQDLRYNTLLTLRRSQVKEWYANDLVHKPGSSK